VILVLNGERKDDGMKGDSQFQAASQGGLGVVFEAG